MEQNLSKLVTTMQINSVESFKAISNLDLKTDCSLLDIRKMGTPPISALVKDGNKNECYQLIKIMIGFLNQYIGTAWSDFQLTEVAKEFYAKYYYWTQADLKNFIRKARSMEFEKILSANQFTPIIFMQWAAQYDFDWTETSIEMSRLEHEKLTYDPARETEIYNHERMLEQRKKTAENTIKSMKQIINSQQQRIEKLKGDDLS